MAVLAQSPQSLSPAAALARATALLAVGERLTAPVAQAVADVDARESYRLAPAGSTRGWLRGLPVGDHAQLARGRMLRRYPNVDEAVRAGRLGSWAADVVGELLDSAPERTDEPSLVGLLENGVPQALLSWTGGSHRDGSIGDTEQQRRHAAVREAVDLGLQDTASPPAQRLEAAFVLTAECLPQRRLRGVLQWLLDALQPEALGDEEETARAEQSWRLVKKRFLPGSRLEVDLSDEDAELVRAELTARTDEARAAREAAVRAATSSAADGLQPDHTTTDTGGADPLDVGAAGSGTPFLDPDIERNHPFDRILDDRGDTPVEGDPAAGDDQDLHDALIELLRDAAAARAARLARPPQADVVVVCTLAALEGRAGAPPGTLVTADRERPLSTEALLRLACDGKLSAVLLDAAGTPIGASSSRRHATEREPRALTAQWGLYCATNGCGRRWTVPHHVEPFWLSGETVLKHLVGICDCCHHDVHDGQKVLRLRDGRLIGPLGWITSPPG